jgi:pSer/pThr/pTyr-binding forkhead associated (FHA) protein
MHLQQATLIDCSTNGLMLNSQLVMEPTILTDGDVIELGQRNFRFEKSDPVSLFL